MKLSPRNRRILQVAALVVVLGVIVTAMLPQPVPVDMASVDRGPLVVTLRHEGKTRVRDRYMVSAPVNGRVKRITLEPGDRVSAGETLVAVFEPDDPTPLDARTRREAEAQVRAAEAELERAEAELKRLAEERSLAFTDLERLERLHAEGIVSQAQLDAARTTARATSEAVSGAEAARRRARFELETAKARIAPVTRGASSERLEIFAPVDGVVLQRLQESESAVLQGAPLVEIADTSRLEIVADFLSTDAVQFEPGMRAVIDGWGGGRELAATLRRVEPFGFMKISALGVEEQRVNVILDFDDPIDAWSVLGDGYRVQVGVVTWEDDDVLRLPASALFREGEEWAVYVIDEGRARLQRLEIARQNGLFAQVSGGLEEGATVIVHPSDAVEEGTRVEER